MSTRRSFHVPEDGAHERLDRWLTAQLDEPSLTRSRLQALLKAGAVLLNGHRARAGVRLQPNDCVEIEIPQTGSGAIEAESFTLSVLHEDDHIIVIDKPSGIVVYPAAGHPQGTVINQLVGHCPLASFGVPLRPGIVHRLDEGTSGVLIVAKSDEAYLNLIEQFKQKTIEKLYWALVQGRVSEDEGRIEGSIGRDPAHRQRMKILSRGKPAVTEFRVLERYARSTLLEVKPLTGRTHQIRVHLSAIGHPVVGDEMYGTARKDKRAERLMLHAWQLKLAHPVTAERLELIAPLPWEFARLYTPQGNHDVIQCRDVRENDPAVEQIERGANMK